MKVVLASKSPRRRELLGEITTDFDIITAECDEELPPDVHPRDGVRILAERKGGAVVADLSPDTLIISSDTLVELDGLALGKPRDEGDAIAMLRSLSGRGHNVHTGVAVHYKGRVYSGTDTTKVVFRELSDSEIAEYVATGEPMDKAGSYGIQGLGGRLVESYEGDFDTVVGLSVKLTKKLIEVATSYDKE
ncbi:MAG: septum formation protein Maf [Clostridia bacterium]|nr:septum formation protein Maf [Clostridia bacterium]